MFGKQADSRKGNAPILSMGAKTPVADGKQFLSRKHVEVCYWCLSLRKTVLLVISPCVVVSMKVTLIAPCQVERKCREGPGHIYEVPGALHKQPEASKQTSPSFSLPRAPRLKVGVGRRGAAGQA